MPSGSPPPTTPPLPPTLPPSLPPAFFPYLLQNLLNPSRLFGVVKGGVEEHTSRGMTNAFFEPI